MESNFYCQLPDERPDESADAFAVDRIWEMRATLCAQVFYPTHKRASLPQSHICSRPTLSSGSIQPFFDHGFAFVPGKFTARYKFEDAEGCRAL